MAIPKPSSSSAELVVPTIDISQFTTDPKTPEQLERSNSVVSQVRDACETIGFFSIVGHGVPRSLQDGVMSGAKLLFDLPVEEKRKLIHPTQKNRGYEILGGQTLQNGAKPDLKEGFYLGKHFDADHPNVKRHPRLMGPNLFPDDSVLPSRDFREPVEQYYNAIIALSHTLFVILARTLGQADDLFSAFVSDDPVCIMRLLHYPPQPPELSDPLQLGAGAHTDFGAITLLYADSPGLEVLNPLSSSPSSASHSSSEKKGEGEKEEKQWVAVPPNRDAYVVNIGDMLSAWTDGRYRSNVHRVRNIGTTDRYSIPFFFDGNADCPLTPFGRSSNGLASPGEKTETASQYLLRRLDETYGAASKT